jgi:hypothetical protein
MSRYVLSIAIPFVLAVIFGAMAVWSAKNGRVLTRGGTIKKEEAPLLFKIGLWWCWLSVAMCLFVGTIAIVHASS